MEESLLLYRLGTMASIPLHLETMTLVRAVHTRFMLKCNRLLLLIPVREMLPPGYSRMRACNAFVAASGRVWRALTGFSFGFWMLTLVATAFYGGFIVFIAFARELFEASLFYVCAVCNCAAILTVTVDRTRTCTTRPPATAVSCPHLARSSPFHSIPSLESSRTRRQPGL